jgi:hypothetical protein
MDLLETALAMVLSKTSKEIKKVDTRLKDTHDSQRSNDQCTRKSDDFSEQFDALAR